MSVDDLVRRSDFIIVAAVLVAETKFVVNKDRLALMKPNAVVINVGRGRKSIIIFTRVFQFNRTQDPGHRCTAAQQSVSDDGNRSQLFH